MSDVNALTLTKQEITRLVELLTPLTEEPFYPESDGEPMAETDTHRDEMTDSLIHPLKQFYRDRSDVYVTGNLFFYYQKGNPRAVVAPDVFVVLGVPNHQRNIYKLWEEGRAPDVVFELTSESTSDKDVGDKRLLYERLKVKEYFLFDPLRDYLEPPLQGFRLVGNYYTAIPVESLGQDNWELDSEVLGLVLRTDGHTLRLFDPLQEAYLLTPAEEAEARRQAEGARRQEEKARRVAEEQLDYTAQKLAAAEAEIARLKTLLTGPPPETA